MLLFQPLRVANAGGTAVYACDLGARPAQCVFDCLRCSAARNKDGLILPIFSPRPEQMKIGSAPLKILPTTLVTIQAFNGGRVWMIIVEIANSVGNSNRCHKALRSYFVDKLESRKNLPR